MQTMTPRTPHQARRMTLSMAVTQITQMIPCTPVILRQATIAWMTAVMARQCSILKTREQQLIDKIAC